MKQTMQIFKLPSVNVPVDLYEML